MGSVLFGVVITSSTSSTESMVSSTVSESKSLSSTHARGARGSSLVSGEAGAFSSEDTILDCGDNDGVVTADLD